MEDPGGKKPTLIVRNKRKLKDQQNSTSGCFRDSKSDEMKVRNDTQYINIIPWVRRRTSVGMHAYDWYI